MASMPSFDRHTTMPGQATACASPALPARPLRVIDLDAALPDGRAVSSVTTDAAAGDVHAERERIATALRDTTVRELFATGLELQAMASLTEGDTRRRLVAIVARLDDAIDGMRHAVYPREPGC